MLESLVMTRKALKRHCSVQLAKEREEFLFHLLRQGSTRGSVRAIATMLFHVVRTMKLKTMRKVTLAEVREAAQRWARYRGPQRMAPSGSYSAPIFTYAAKKWLRFHGKLVMPSRPPHPFAAALADYGEYMKSVGLSVATVRSHTWKAGKFLLWLHRHRKRLDNVSLRDVDKFLLFKGANGWNPTTVAMVGQALRSFFRHAESQAWCKTGIARGIKGPAIPKYNPLPQGPTWQQVQLLLRETRGDKPAAIRARAILLLLAIYGLRSSEVVGLLLKDFDWHERKFTVRRSKRGGFQQYPIQREVGNAILRYIAEARPPCSCENLFVSRHPPYRPMCTNSLHTLTERRIRRMGISSPRRGPHSFRHSCATRLLELGLPLPEIAEFLGHRTSQSVGIYAKFDIESLKRVADFDLGGLL